MAHQTIRASEAAEQIVGGELLIWMMWIEWWSGWCLWR